MRKAAIFLHSSYGFVFQDLDSNNEHASLCQILRIPPFEVIFSPKFLKNRKIKPLIVTWLENLTIEFTMISPFSPKLVQLPMRLDNLIQKTLSADCLRCRMKMKHPCLCLMCGKYVCGDDFLCGNFTKDIHFEQCCSSYEILFLVTKNVIAVNHYSKSVLIESPYLDDHGEPDEGLERGRLLFYNEERFKEIEKKFAKHSIPSYVSGKIGNGEVENFGEYLY